MNIQAFLKNYKEPENYAEAIYSGYNAKTVQEELNEEDDIFSRIEKESEIKSQPNGKNYEEEKESAYERKKKEELEAKNKDDLFQ